MNEQEKYEVIKKLVETKGSVKRAALKLDCSVRTIYNHIRGYKETGKEHFVHEVVAANQSTPLPQKKKSGSSSCTKKNITIKPMLIFRIHWKRIRKPTYQPLDTQIVELKKIVYIAVLGVFLQLSCELSIAVLYCFMQQNQRRKVGVSLFYEVKEQYENQL